MTVSPPLIYAPIPGTFPPPPSAIGGKAHNLAQLAALGLPTPRWIVLTATAFDAAFGDTASRQGSAGETATRQQALRTLELPVSLRATILSALTAAGLQDRPLAVRSSAVVEDAAGASYAGQFDSLLNIRGETALWGAIRHVWASALNAHAATYAQSAPASPLPPSLPPPPMAVILQEMVVPCVSGVAFSADPVTGARDTVVINAVCGLGEALVSGELEADTYRLCGISFEQNVVRKERALRPDPMGGTRWERIPAALQAEPTLTEAEVRQIATVARQLEEGLGTPQDVEWALVDEEGAERRLVVLQSRPITAVPAGNALTPGERRLWDNSNIVESYGGVTTPLTFSFARSVYEDAYRQFCRLLGVSEPLLEEHRPVFAHMLGYLQGRVYYNLLNWYRALALLPGYSLNRAFMERMMGVRQKLADPPPAPYVAGRTEDALRLARMVGRLFREHRRLPREVVAFHARVEAALGPLAQEELCEWSPDALADRYQRLESELLRQWRAPLVNDFLAMIVFGILGRLVEQWLPEAPPTLLNDLLCGEGGIISTEPARRVMELAGQVAASPALTAAFAAEPDDAALWSRIRTTPALQPFHAALRDYLDRFGDRCAHELKLETVTLRQQPELLLQTVRAYVAAGHFDAEASRAQERRIRTAAEALVRTRLRGPRRHVFLVVLRQTRHRVRDRENLRFERTRAFGLARRIFLALGHHYATRGRLAAPRDIFYLTKEEIFSDLNGTGLTTDLAALATLRRAEFAANEAAPPLPERFETFGAPSDGDGCSGVQVFGCSGVQADGTDGTDGMDGTKPTDPGDRLNTRTPEHLNTRTPVLRGTGCCPGIVRAPVRVVRDPRQAREVTGHILVAERTDPGWTLLFPIARGLLVQRGSLLSHSAIVAREMGLPCIVGIAGLLETLRDGDWVEMDGTTGEVRGVSEK